MVLAQKKLIIKSVVHTANEVPKSDMYEEGMKNLFPPTDLVITLNRYIEQISVVLLQLHVAINQL